MKRDPQAIPVRAPGSTAQGYSYTSTSSTGAVGKHVADEETGDEHKPASKRHKGSMPSAGGSGTGTGTGGFVGIIISADIAQCSYPGCGRIITGRLKDLRRHARQVHDISGKGATATWHVCQVEGCNFYAASSDTLREHHTDGTCPLLFDGQPKSSRFSAPVSTTAGLSHTHTGAAPPASGAEGLVSRVDARGVVHCTYPGCGFMPGGGTKHSREHARKNHDVGAGKGGSWFVCRGHGCGYYSCTSAGLFAHMHSEGACPSRIPE